MRHHLTTVLRIGPWALRATVLTWMLVLFPASMLAADRSPGAAPVEAKVTYVSGATVYLDAGTDRGLAEGSIVEVVRAVTVVARLTVGYVTAKRASATSEGNAPAAEVKAGDTVRFVPVVAAAPAAGAAAAAAGAGAAGAAPADPGSAGRTGLRGAGVRGRIGLRWLSVNDRSGFGQDFSQPSLDLRLSGIGVGGTAIDFDVDCRPRRTYRTNSDGSSGNTSSNRIYSLMGAYRPGPFRIALGRQMNPSLGSVILFDGLTAEYRTPRFAAGLVAGSEPDPEDFSFDSVTKDFGLYVEGASAAGATTRWWINGGAVSSTTDGEINRDWVYVTGRLTHKGFQGMLLQEVDVNRGWRKELEESSVTRSGTFLSLRQRFYHGWSAMAGWDSRRDVPVYRDRVTPATEFDDAYRQGVWGGLEWRAPHWLVGLDGRQSSGGTAGTADAYTLQLGTMGWTATRLDARLRVTRYTTPIVEGDLYAGTLAFDFWDGRLRWDVHGGMRDEQDTSLFAESVSVGWIGTEFDLLAVRHLLLTLAFDRTTGGDEDNDQLYLSCSYRF